MVIAIVDRIYHQPFEWGRSDCCTRACDVVAEVTGIDVMAPLRGRYNCARSATRLIGLYDGWEEGWAHLCRRAGFVRGATAPGRALGSVPGAAVGHALAVAVPGGWAAPYEGGVVILPEVEWSWGQADG